MKHARKPSAAPEKRKQPSDEMITSAERKIIYSDDDSDEEDAAFTPTTAGNSSALPNRIQVVKHGKKIRRTSATVIKDALCVGKYPSRPDPSLES